MITYTTDNFFAVEGVRVIPVNTKGVTGAGLARAWAQRDPENARYYREFCAGKGRHAPFEGGDILMLSGFPPTVLAATKEHWRNPSQIEWVEDCITNIAERSRKPIGLPVLIPQLGCGLGGLNWNDVRPLLIEHLAPNTANTYILFGPEEGSE